MDGQAKFNLIKNKKVIGVIALVLIAIPLTVSLFAVIQKQKAGSKSQVLASSQVNDILVKVSKLIDVPNETPTIATISDVTKLAGQEFFKKAQNDDKVIIFPKAQKAILYRPGTNKIVEVAFYNPPATTPQINKEAVATPAPTQSVSLRDLIKEPTTSPMPSASPVPTSINSSVTPTSIPLTP